MVLFHDQASNADTMIARPLTFLVEGEQRQRAGLHTVVRLIGAIQRKHNESTLSIEVIPTKVVL